MSRSHEFGEGVGLSRREQDEIQGRAIGSHIWDSMERAFGDYATAVRSDAYDRMRESGYGTDDIKMDSDEGPYVEHRSGPYRARWHGGTYADIHHSSEPGHAIDTMHVGHEAPP
jgi:hypothetical protein